MPDKEFLRFVCSLDRDGVLSRRAFAECWRVPDKAERIDREEALRVAATQPADDRLCPGLGLAPARFDEAARLCRAEYEADPEGFIESALSGGLWAPVSALLAKELPPVYFVVEGFLPAGLAMLAAPPKFGKSWMVLDLCAQVAAGGRFLGMQCRQSAVLYLALEDSERRLQGRLRRVLGGRDKQPGLYYQVRAGILDGELLSELESFMSRHPDCRLIVIDTLQKVRGSASKPGSMYAEDYGAMGKLKAFADRCGLCLLLVHHLRKMGDDSDPFNRISGSNGLFGSLDTAITLTRPTRNDPQTTLSLTGRDVDENSLVLYFDRAQCRWQLLGSAEKLRAQELRGAYDSSPLVRTIRRALDENASEWDVSGAGLLDGCEAWFGARPAGSPQELSKKLDELAPLLLEYDCIRYTKLPRRSGGKTHQFRRLSETAATQAAGAVL